MDIAYTINSNYIKYLYISLLSLLESNKGSDLCIHMLSYDLTVDNKDVIRELTGRFGQKVMFYNISDIKAFENRTSIGYGVEVYLRFFMPMELKKVSRVLFLDADTIIRGDLSELFNIDMTDMALAGCPDGKLGHRLLKSRNAVFKRTDDFAYYNAGVMIWNLDYIRDNTKFDDFIKVMDLFGNRLFFNDQDILNYLFHKKIVGLVSSKYNYMPDEHKEDETFEDDLENALIIHYAGCNPWKNGKKNRLDYKIWWGYASRSPFYDEIVEETLHNTAKLIDDREKQNRIYQAYSEYRLNGRNIADNELVANSDNIVIYGAGAWGRLLIDEMQAEIRKVKYIVDKKSGGKLNEFDIVSIDRMAHDKDADLIIITPYKYAEEIKNELAGIVDAPMIGLVELFEGNSVKGAK